MAKIANKTTIRNDQGSPFGVMISFADGRKVNVDLDALSPEIFRELAAHGLSQKLGDSYSGCGGSLDMAYAECSSVAEALAAGDWNRRGGGDGGDLPNALHRVTNKPLEDCIALVAGMDDDTKKDLRKHPQIKVALAEIKTERAKAQAGSKSGTDLADLF